MQLFIRFRPLNNSEGTWYAFTSGVAGESPAALAQNMPGERFDDDVYHNPTATRLYDRGTHDHRRDYRPRERNRYTPIAESV